MLPRNWRSTWTMCVDGECGSSPRLVARHTAGRRLGSFGGRKPSGAPPVAELTGRQRLWPSVCCTLFSTLMRFAFVRTSGSRASRAGAPDKALLAFTHLARAKPLTWAGATGFGCAIERSTRPETYQQACNCGGKQWLNVAGKAQHATPAAGVGADCCAGRRAWNDKFWGAICDHRF